ncbi:hypothetical protein V1264_019148 [Littorina saxatilis]|uniref:Uncharacterized protein n=1 Tax=Littorina saxatilis TaxID=31220 RepID=A0AAN9BFY5_9CAEN
MYLPIYLFCLSPTLNRSYRNPKQAEILADFTARAGSKSDRGGRPKTVPSRRPIVPQPYFFRDYSIQPGADAIAAQHRQLGHHSSLTGTEDVTGNYFNSTSRILASPGAGCISRSLHSRLQSPANLIPASSAAGGSLHDTVPARHTTSPTDDLDKQDIAPIVKGFQSGASTSRTAQDSEVSGASQSQAGAAAAAGVGEAESDVTAEITNTPEVRVAVVPTARPLDSTADSNTTLDDSVIPRPLPELSVTSDTTPRHAPEDDQSVSFTTGDSVTPRPEVTVEVDDISAAESNMADNNNEGGGNRQMPNFANVTIYEDDIAPSTTEDQKPRPKLTASNSGADIMLGLETEEGQSAEVEIDTADQEELMPEAEAPKGRLRKASITEKVIKTKASEAIAAMIKEEAESRQRDFEKLLDEHAELVQEISRTPSSENLIQGERDH